MRIPGAMRSAENPLTAFPNGIVHRIGSQIDITRPFHSAEVNACLREDRWIAVMARIQCR